MGKKNKQIPGDDGRRIADMNIEGMPWYRPERTKRVEPTVKSEPVQGQFSMPKASAREMLAAIFGALGAAYLVALVFIAAFGLFLLFCTKVWFS